MNLGYIFYDGLASSYYELALRSIKTGNYTKYASLLDTGIAYDRRAQTCILRELDDGTIQREEIKRHTCLYTGPIGQASQREW